MTQKSAKTIIDSIINVGLIMEVSIDGERTRFHFFLYQKLKEILIRYSRIILTASKDRLISKI